jgi:putative MATE family efflux protein
MQQENNITTAPISKLIRMVAIPASIGFFFNTMYNIVDSYFAGKIGSEALAAVSISFPIFFIIIAIGYGLSSGNTVIMSHALGQQDKKKAYRIARQAISFSVLISIFVAVAGLFLSPYLFKILGASGSYLDQALIYTNPMFYFAFFFIAVFILNSILSAHGDTKSFRNFIIVGFFLNIGFNPLLMYGLNLGDITLIPKLGLAGISYATVLTQIIGTVYLGYKVKKIGVFENAKISEYKPEKSAYQDIAKQGLPTSLSMMSVALGIFIITYYISQFGSHVVAAYGLSTRIEQIALLPLIGLGVAAVTLIGQNSGAGRLDRVKETIDITLKYNLYVSVLCTAGIFFGAKFLLQFFTKDIMILDAGVEYLHIASFLVFGYGVLTLVDSVFRGIKKPLFSLYLGITRQIILPVVFFFIATKILNLGIIGIWWSVFAIVALSSVFAFWYMRRVVR